MPDNLTGVVIVYIIAVNVFAVTLTLLDKHAARLGSWRVKERTLLIFAVLGGSAAMYVTMRLARHKTRHAKFMIGIPVVIVLQAAAVLLIWWLKRG
ncbi:MAG: DUF1294 domain-containing protein [Firmicutes bacterium]|nr:DUF1294 domain-containing protein [Bacillota bacterium]